MRTLFRLNKFPAKRIKLKSDEGDVSNNGNDIEFFSFSLKFCSDGLFCFTYKIIAISPDYSKCVFFCFEF